MIERYINVVESNNTNIEKNKIDNLKNKLFKISDFFNLISRSQITCICPLNQYMTPKSEYYNNFLSLVESDLNNIYNIQNEIRNNIVTEWNGVETELISMTDNSLYDNSLTLEYPKANIIGDYILPSSSNESSLLSSINGVPIINAETNNSLVPVFYGKQFGSYVKGNESSEDGIRYCDIETPFKNDSFFEVEAVTLEGKRDNTINFQTIIKKDINLKCTIKYIFTENVYINAIKIKPVCFASNIYFKIDKIEISDGISFAYPELFTDTIIDETIFNFTIPDNFINKKVRSVTIYLHQDKGYQMKYSLAYYKYNNNESWLDITGSHVVELAKINENNFDDGVNTVITNADQWIMNYWLPKVRYSDNPILDVSKGTNGYYIVPTNESKRKRYAIGISNIDLMNVEYNNISEIISKDIDIDDNINSVSLEMDKTGTVYTYLSFDAGTSWNRINPIGSSIEYDDDYKIIPTNIKINSDLSLERKILSDTGVKGYADNFNNKLKVKFILVYENEITPIVKNWKVNFKLEE